MKKLPTLVVLISAAFLCSCGADKSASTPKDDSAQVETIEQSDPITNEEESAGISSSSSSEDWDDVLDSYEEYIDEYIVLMKKAQAGDTSAMSEYISMLEKAEDLQTKLQNASSELSTAQAARLAKIASKMSSAAAAAM